MKLASALAAAIVCLVLPGPAALRAQDAEVNERIVPLLEALAPQSGATAEEVRAAIRELGGLGIDTSAGASCLLNRANILYEADPVVRAEALAAFARCCPERDRRNRMVALRLVRMANPAVEPDPRVRRAALEALAGFRCTEASERIEASSRASGEPDAELRKRAQELLAGTP